MKREGPFQLTLLIGCLGMLAGGCQQWTLSVEKGDITFVPGRPVQIQVLAKRGAEIPGPNGIAVTSFAAPDPIKIRLATRDEWTHFTIERLDADNYVYTLTGTVDETTEYVIDAKAAVVGTEGKGRGPYQMAIDPLYLQGLEVGQKQRDGRLQAYRLVIELREKQWSASEMEAFLAGFATAYEEDDDKARGQRCADVLRDAIQDRAYAQGFQQGQRHIDKQITSAYVQTLIGRNVGQAGMALAWKAGYINGFAQEFSRKKHTDTGVSESSLQLGETMYDSLKHGIGL